MHKLEERAVIYSVVAVLCAGIASVTSPAAGFVTLIQILMVIETLYWFYNPLIRHVS